MVAEKCLKHHCQLIKTYDYLRPNKAYLTKEQKIGPPSNFESLAQFKTHWNLKPVFFNLGSAEPRGSANIFLGSNKHLNILLLLFTYIKVDVLKSFVRLGKIRVG